jgi:hypothetical protein
MTRSERFDLKLSVLRDEDVRVRLVVMQFKQFNFYENRNEKENKN